MITHYNNIASYITKDGSSIRELMHPDLHGNGSQSLAEATVPAGTQTQLHLHKQSEEIYHITGGQGLMTLGDQQFSVQMGDSILISANTPHQIFNNHSEDLVFLCVCSPAYSHQDTILL